MLGEKIAKTGAGVLFGGLGIYQGYQTVRQMDGTLAMIKPEGGPSRMVSDGQGGITVQSDDLYFSPLESWIPDLVETAGLFLLAYMLLSPKGSK